VRLEVLIAIFRAAERVQRAVMLLSKSERSVADRTGEQLAERLNAMAAELDAMSGGNSHAE
jgi:hypothetical protein